MDERVHCNLILTKPFELLANGRIYAQPVQARIFNPNIYKASGLIACDIFRLIFVLILLYFLSLEITEKRKALIEAPHETISIKMLISVFISVSFLISEVYKLKYCNYVDGDFYNANKIIYIVIVFNKAIRTPSKCLSTITLCFSLNRFFLPAFRSKSLISFS